MLVVKSTDPTARVEVWLNGVKVMSRGALEAAAGAEATQQLTVQPKNVLVMTLYGQEGASATVAVVRVQAAQLALPGVRYAGMTFSAFHLEGGISSTGRFEFTPLPAGVSQVVFLESPNISDVVPIVVPAAAGARITVDPTLIAKSYVALHPDLGPVSSAEQPSLFARLDSMPSMATLTREADAALRAGRSILDWPAAETPAKAVIAELQATSVSPRLRMRPALALQRPFGTVCPGTQPGPANRTPLVCRDPQGVWGIENPRALFLGSRIDGNDMPFVDPADFQSHYVFFRTTVPRWTGFQNVSLNAPHDLELYDGFGTGSDLVTTGANSALIIGKGLQSFGIPAIEVVNCGVAVFRAGGAAVATVTASVTNAAANWRGSGNIKLFASTLSSVTGLIGTCVKAAIGNGNGISASTKWWANAFSAVSKLLKSATWVLSGGAASELGYVLAAAFDPLPSNRYAFYDDGAGHLTVSGAIWFTSNVAGATVTANGSVQGGTPLPVIDLPVGSVPYAVSAAGYQSLAASANTIAGRWTAVNAVLTPGGGAPLLGGTWHGTTRNNDSQQSMFGAQTYLASIDFDATANQVQSAACGNPGTITSKTSTQMTINFPGCGVEVLNYSIQNNNTFTGQGTHTAQSGGRTYTTWWNLNPRQLAFSDDFSNNLGNWTVQNPDGLGSWSTPNSELIGDYDISCGGPSCNHTQLLLADALQPGSGNWRMEVQSNLVQAYCCYNGGAVVSFAKFVLWISNSQKEAIDVGYWWQGLTAPSSYNSVVASHESYPWVSIGNPTLPTVLPWSPTQWQTGVLEKHGNTYTVYFNGQQIYSTTRTFPSAPKIGFSTYGKVRMDNFKLYTLP